MGVKVAIVGAGSTYTPELVEGFIRRADRFPVDELALLDVDPSRLEVVGGLARRMLDRAGFGGRMVLTRRAKGRTVTVAVTAMTFHRPVYKIGRASCRERVL